MQARGDPAVVGAPEGSAVLARYADGELPPLREASVVDDVHLWLEGLFELQGQPSPSSAIRPRADRDALLKALTHGLSRGTCATKRAAIGTTLLRSPSSSRPVRYRAIALRRSGRPTPSVMWSRNSPSALSSRFGWPGVMPKADHNGHTSKTRSDQLVLTPVAVPACDPLRQGTTPTEIAVATTTLVDGVWTNQTSEVPWEGACPGAALGGCTPLARQQSPF